MIENNTLCVIIPTYNDGHLLRDTIEGIPDFIDKIIVINDGCNEDSAKIIDGAIKKDSRVEMILHEKNLGLGQSLIDGYLKSLESKFDITIVMAGDNQMSPNDLNRVISPILANDSDYVKGNRLLRDDVIDRMPFYRFIGNSVLTLLSKIATGYWKIIDPQCGYSAISYKALKSIRIGDMIKGYGYNAHILNMLNLNNFRVVDVEVEPVYGDEKSKIKIMSYIFTVSRLLTRLTFRRIIRKYLIVEFHPLIFFYFFGFFNCFFISFPLVVRFFYKLLTTGFLPQTTLLVTFFSFSIGMLSIFLGMWLDMEDNKRLVGKASKEINY